MRFVYNLLWPLGLLLFLPGYVVKMIRRGGYREKFGQRLGWYDVDLRSRLQKRRSTWLHAVSVGEVAVALKEFAKRTQIKLEGHSQRHHRHRAGPPLQTRPSLTS